MVRHETPTISSLTTEVNRLRRMIFILAAIAFLTNIASYLIGASH